MFKMSDLHFVDITIDLGSGSLEIHGKVHYCYYEYDLGRGCRPLFRESHRCPQPLAHPLAGAHKVFYDMVG